MVRPCVARGFHRSVGFAVLHQCIRPLIGACCAPGHHGYQRACDLSQAAKSRPLANASPSPIAATIALEMIGPIPGTLISRSQPASPRDGFDRARQALDALMSYRRILVTERVRRQRLELAI